MEHTLDNLKEASLNHLLKKRTRAESTGCLIFGVLAVFMGMGMESLLDPILILIGLFLIVSGIWSLTDPSPRALKTNGIALIIVGVWNILISLSAFFIHLKGAEGGNFFFDILFIFVGIFQIRLGVKTNIAAGWFQEIFDKEILKDLVPQLENLEKELRKADPKKEADIISFEAAEFRAKFLGKARLQKDMIIILNQYSGQIFFLAPGEIEISENGKTLLKNAYKINLNIQDYSNLDKPERRVETKKQTGTMPVEDYEKFKKWKESFKPADEKPKTEGPGLDAGGNEMITAPDDI